VTIRAIYHAGTWWLNVSVRRDANFWAMHAALLQPLFASKAKFKRAVVRSQIPP
jgi:hypothetical protein